MGAARLDKEVVVEDEMKVKMDNKIGSVINAGHKSTGKNTGVNTQER